MVDQLRKQHYRRPLPSSCIAFASEEGKQIFKEAMNTSYMNCYFNLAAQFRTQEEPAYCGLSTLVMVLNALSVDPGRVWKGPWRWYHENMLDCCIPLSVAEKKGITLFQFSCLAKCNGLDVDMVQAKQPAIFEEFKNIVQRISQCDNQVLVCSYSRKTLGQSGDGHFSPIGGYHIGRELVLIFDVARFKYPPHWVPVELLWKAMQGPDIETGQPRGYMILKPTAHTGNPTILFRISKNFDLTVRSKWKPELLELLQNWWTWLGASCEVVMEKNEYFKEFVSKFLSLWCTKSFSACDELLIMRIDVKCCGQLSEGHKCAISELLDSLEKLSLFHVVEESLRSGNYEICHVWDSVVQIVEDSPVKEQLCCARKEKISNSKLLGMTLAHFATMILLSWPYVNSESLESQEVTHAGLCSQFIAQEMSNVARILKSEVELLKGQLATIFFYYQTMDSSYQFEKNLNHMKLTPA